MKTPDDRKTDPLKPLPRGRWLLFWGLVALGCVGAPTAAITMLAVAVKPFPCTTFEPVCNGVVRDLVSGMPILAMITGLLVGGIGGGVAVHQRRSPGRWVFGAWLVLVSGCVYSWITLAAGPDTQALEADMASDHARRLAEMRARPDFETIQARYNKMQQQLADATAAAVPGLRWPGSSLLDEQGNLCNWDDAHGRGFHGTGAAIVTGYAAITDTQWTALDIAVRDLTGRYGFTSQPAYRSTGPSDPEPSQFVLTTPDGARIEGYLTKFGHELTLSFTTPCYLPKVQH